jgi:tetratricopeptide (TPR) repeat protein
LAFIVDVFLSSTAEDLKKYTDAVYERLNKHEMFRCTHQRDFGARDAATVNYCRERVLKAELYVGVFGMRRGWEPKGDDKKRSITQMEHDWARDSSKPRFLYVTPASFSVPGDKPEPMTMHKRQLAFRKKVMGEGERLVSQKGFESPELLAAEIVSQLVLQVATSGLIKMFRSDLATQDPASPNEQRPAITAAVERLAADEDVDLLALAKNPKNVDLGDLEAKLRARAEAQETLGLAALKNSAEYWRHIGALAFLHNTRKALASYEKAVVLDPLDPDGWRHLGELQFRLGDLVTAERSFTRLRELGKSADDPRVQSLACVRLGWVSESHGELTKAETLFAGAVQFAESAEWLEGMARAYCNLGLIHKIRGNIGSARQMHLKALKIEEELGNKDGMARAYGNIGNTYRARGDVDEAEKMQRMALALDAELGNKEGMATDYVNLGNIHLDRDETDKAEEMYRKALTLNEEVGSKEGMALAYANLGLLLHSQHDLEKAEQMERMALALYQELHSKEGVAGSYKKLGIICQSKGDKASMCEYWRKARDIYREMDLPDKVAEVETWLKPDESGDS